MGRKSKEKNASKASKFDWNIPKLQKIFSESDSYEKLIKNLEKLFNQKRKGKKNTDDWTSVSFYQSAVAVAKRKGFWTPEKHKAKPSWMNLTEKEKEEFTQLYYAGLKYRVIAEKMNLKDETEVLNFARSLGLSKEQRNQTKQTLKETKKEVSEEQEDVSELDLDEEEKKILNIAEKLLAEKRYFRVSDVCNEMHITKQSEKARIRGILVSLSGKGYIVSVSEPDHFRFYSNMSFFYTPEELVSITSEGIQARILKEISGSGPVKISQIAQQLFGSPTRAKNFIQTILDYYTETGILNERKEFYSITEAGKEFGVDEQSIKTLKTTRLENEVFAYQKAKKFNSLKEVETALLEDSALREVKPFDITDMLKKTSKEELKILFLSEVLYGNQNTDQALLNFILQQVPQVDISLISGLVQGSFAGTNVDKARTLADKVGLERVSTQFNAVNLLFEQLEKQVTGKIFYVLGDDDWNLAKDYAWLAQLAEGKTGWVFGVNKASLTAELQRRLYIKEFYRKFKIQWEIIIPYQYRIGRSLLNSEEVCNLIGVKKSELRLIIEILVAKRSKNSYPKDYEKIVNVDFLFGNSEKRIVTSDSLLLKVGDREIQFVHNTNFSDVTQYVDPIQTPEKILRHFGARGEKLPWILADAHQEFFYATYFHGHWVMTLPGMQDSLSSARYKKESFSTRILSSKSLRQNTFRKSPATSGVVALTAHEDGRIDFRLINNKTKSILEAQKDEPHTREVVCFITDTQHGSITMEPEFEMRFMDYALYERKADRLYENGDIIQGAALYPNFFSENRPMRLTSIDSQQRFTDAIQTPLIVKAPNLKDFVLVLGNHEWNTFGSALSGQNNLYSLEVALNAHIKESEHPERLISLKRAISSNRIRFKRSPNPHQGDVVMFPYYATDICGFKIAFTHMWQPRGGGRTPVEQQRRWILNMADAAGDIDILFGGHKHSVWMAQEYGKFLVQLGASASNSGFDMSFGYYSTVMYTLVTFDNKEGVTVEFIPWEFLEKYKCQSPFLKGKDAELNRPKEGTLEYKHGKMSPFIEDIIDGLAQYGDV